MTPEERIAELAAARGGVATLPRVVRPMVEPAEPAKPSKPNGFGIVLPLAWRRTPDNWGHREHRERLKALETYLAAGVIVRYLGKEWRREHDEHGRVVVKHRDGYGFCFKRDWQNSGRFQSSPLETYKRDEPPSITTSATRSLGAIARDIENRLVNNGLREAYEQQQAANHERREEIRSRFAAITTVARAFGGRILPKRRWKADGYPEADLPGGLARIGYGFDDGAVELNLAIGVEDAERIGALFR